MRKSEEVGNWNPYAQMTVLNKFIALPQASRTAKTLSIYIAARKGMLLLKNGYCIIFYLII